MTENPLVIEILETLTRDIADGKIQVTAEVVARIARMEHAAVTRFQATKKVSEKEK